jgi:glycosyltransferase involved in cell wall biosynthesis
MLRFSVIVSTCHSNAELSECLKCLAPRTQTLPAEQYEVIVVDDGRKTTAYITVHDHFRWTTWTPGPRHGPAANRNHGALVSSGEWLIFIEDRSRPEKAWLANLATALESGHATVYAGRTTCSRGMPSPRYAAPVNEDGTTLPANNLMILRNVFDEIGVFDETFEHGPTDEIDFRDRLKKAGVAYAFVPDAVVDYEPNRLPWGTARAAAYASEVAYREKQALAHPGTLAAVWGVGKARLRTISKSRKGLGTVSALISTGVELATVAVKYRGWKKQRSPVAAPSAPEA